MDVLGVACVKQCPLLQGMPFIGSIPTFFSFKQCSQCAGDMGTKGVITISIDSPCIAVGMGISFANAIGITQRLPRSMCRPRTAETAILI